MKDLNISEILQKFKEELDSLNNTKVKCAIIGRSGTGKSSLINAIAGIEIAEVGEVETTMEIGEPIHYNGLEIFDFPGCGTTNFPRSEYLSHFNIAEFDCVILTTSDRFYEDDLFLIDELIKLKVPVFTTRTKIDYSVDRAQRRGVSETETINLIYNNLKESLKGYRVNGIYLTSSDFPNEYDLSNLLEDIVKCLSNFKRDRFISDITITNENILKLKRELAEKLVYKYSAIAGLNSLNPIPGLDIAADIGIMVKMAQNVRDIYGLNEEQQKFISQFLDNPKLPGLISKVAQYATKYGTQEGLLILLKKVSISAATKMSSKWVPLVGQAIAAGIGFQMTSFIGNQMINDAEAIVTEILNSYKSFSNPNKV